MKNGEVKVTKAWTVRNWKSIQKAQESPHGFIRLSPRREVVEKCREECGYSESVMRTDIWQAIMRRVKQIKENS